MIRATSKNIDDCNLNAFPSNFQPRWRMHCELNTISRWAVIILVYRYTMIFSSLGRVTHIYGSVNAAIINGMWLALHQDIIKTSAGLWFNWTLGTNSVTIINSVQIFLQNKIHLKTPPAKCWPLFLGLNVVKQSSCVMLTFRYLSCLPAGILSCVDLCNGYRWSIG